MAFILKKYRADRLLRKKMKNLYNTAFPSEERAPFIMLMSKLKKGKAEMYTAFDGEAFVGFAYLVCADDLAYLFYLAVDENCRGKGYGGMILTELKKLFDGKRLFLAREQLDESAPNFAQRESRHRFYLRCGFTDLPCCIKEATVVYDVMSNGGKILPEEYEMLMTKWAGRLMMRFIDMKLFEK